MKKLLLSITLSATVLGCGGNSSGQANALTPSSAEPSGSATDGGADNFATPTCAEAKTSLLARYAQLRVCSRDEDCNYVDRFYTIVDRNDFNHFVRTFDCLADSPFLVVANGAALRAVLPELAAQQKTQAELCAPPPGTFRCQAFGGFVSTHPPVCRGGKCQAIEDK